jgi:hypothetical protein
VGTVDLAWPGPGSKYVEGVQNVAFRARYVSLSKAVAAKFVARYPTVTVDWYLTYEANLNDLFYPAVEGAYADMLVSEMHALTVLRPSAEFSWSPAFWYPYSAYRKNTAGMTQLAAMLTTFFSTLRTRANGIQMLDLQDYVAGSSCQPAWNRVTPADAVGWARFLTNLGGVPDVRINVEQYAVDCTTGGIVAGRSQDVLAREAFYAKQGVRLGPTFEARYWLPIHGYSLQG